MLLFCSIHVAVNKTNAFHQKSFGSFKKPACCQWLFVTWHITQANFCGWFFFLRLRERDVFLIILRKGEVLVIFAWLAFVLLFFFQHPVAKCSTRILTGAASSSKRFFFHSLQKSYHQTESKYGILVQFVLFQFLLRPNIRMFCSIHCCPYMVVSSLSAM